MVTSCVHRRTGVETPAGAGASSDAVAITVSRTDTAPKYLPAITKWYVPTGSLDPRLELLNSLADPALRPFTKEQESIFSWSRKISLITKTYLGPRGYALVITAGTCGGLAGIRFAKYANISDDSWLGDFIPFVFGASVGVTAGVLGILFTGTFPDKKSDAANDEQDENLEIKEQFDQAALYLLNLYWSKKPEKHARAVALAGDISDNLEAIRGKIDAATTRKNIDQLVLEGLRTTIDYIKARADGKIILEPFGAHIKLEQIKKHCKKPPCLPIPAPVAPAPVAAAESREASAAGTGAVPSALTAKV